MTNQEIIRDAIAAAVKRPIAEIKPASRLAEDLGLRSLKRVELAVVLEDKLGKPVPETTVMRARTVADLERALGL